MFEELFRIVFDRRHIKDVRVWVLIVLVISEASGFFFYDKYRVQPRFERQGLRIKQIITVGKFRNKIEALPKEKGETKP